MGCVQSGEQRYVIPFDDKARNAHVEHYIPPRFPIDPQLVSPFFFYERSFVLFWYLKVEFFCSSK